MMEGWEDKKWNDGIMEWWKIKKVAGYELRIESIECRG
jgi:hypothetical protein